MVLLHAQTYTTTVPELVDADALNLSVYPNREP